MATVTPEYVQGLPSIYQEILRAYPRLEPGRRAGYGLMLQTLYEELRGEFSPEEIKHACEQMADGAAVTIQQGGFVRPTNLGEDIIAALTGHRSAPERAVPPFPPPPKGE